MGSKVPFCQTPVGLSTCSMFGRALHRAGSPPPQEQVLRPTGVWHFRKWNLYGQSPNYASRFHRIWRKDNIDFEEWNSQAHRKFPGSGCGTHTMELIAAS